MSDLPDIVKQFRERIAADQNSRGLKDKPYAEDVLCIKYQTFRNFMGKDPKRPARQGPSLETIGQLITQLGKERVWELMTGELPPVRDLDPDPQIDQLMADFTEWANNRAEQNSEFAGWLRYELSKIRKRADD